jgi:hypothetical protein
MKSLFDPLAEPIPVRSLDRWGDPHQIKSQLVSLVFDLPAERVLHFHCLSEDLWKSVSWP